MKRTLIIYVVIIAVLGAVAYWLFASEPQKTTLEDSSSQYEFYITDTAAIDRIVLYDKTPSRVELSRVEDGWLVDGEQPARDDAVLVLLATMYRMQLKNFIPKRMQTTVLKRMSVYGTTVEVYGKDGLIKSFIVGTNTEDEMGTYMMLKGAKEPFAVHIPGFNGFLSTRFFTEAHLWRKQIITDVDPKKVRRVDVLYPDSAMNSFSVLRDEDSIRLFRTSYNEELIGHQSNLELFLFAAANMRYEGVIVPSDPIYGRKDSLLNSSPVFEVVVTMEDGKTTNLKGYKIKGSDEFFDPDVEAPEYDPDRLHGIIDDEQMVLIQYYGLRKVLKKADFFKNSL